METFLITLRITVDHDNDLIPTSTPDKWDWEEMIGLEGEMEVEVVEYKPE